MGKTCTNGKLKTDSVIAPLKNRRLSLTNVSWLLDTRKDTMKTYLHIVARLQRTIERRRRGGKGIVFEEIRPGAGFETSDFVTETLGGLPLNDSETGWSRNGTCKDVKKQHPNTAQHVQK